ncbi:hypothetical protein ACUSIJ_28995 [Pseudochelatococcus sp. B33]
MTAKLDCPSCGARAMSARDKLLWLEPATGIPCRNCGQKLTLPYWGWQVGAVPFYLLVILGFAGHVRSWAIFLPAAAAGIAIFLFSKVFLVPLVPARRSKWTPYPWRNKRSR